MPVPKIDPALQQALNKRQWFLRAETHDGVEFVYLYLDMTRGGHQIGYAQDSDGYWQTWALVRPNSIWCNDCIGTYRSFDAALRAILAYALF